MRVVADTHALIWFLEADQRLSARAREALQEAQQDPDSGIVASVASRLDLHYLQRAGRFSPADVQRWWAVTEDPSWNIGSSAITGPVVAYFDSAELASLGDPWDRLITATAIDLGVPPLPRTVQSRPSEKPAQSRSPGSGARPLQYTDLINRSIDREVSDGIATTKASQGTGLYTSAAAGWWGRYFPLADVVCLLRFAARPWARVAVRTSASTGATRTGCVISKPGTGSDHRPAGWCGSTALTSEGSAALALTVAE